MSKKEKSKGELNKGFFNRIDVPELWNSIPEKLKTPAIFLAILILILFFYYPVVFGEKTIQSMDVLQNKALREYTSKEKDGFTLWNPHVFCGMPAYATAVAQRTFDITAYTYSLASRIYSAFWKDYTAIYTFSFLIMAITAFLFMRAQGGGRGVSLLTAVGMIFSTGIVNLFFSGHTTKLVSLSLIPFLFMLFLKFQKGIKVFDFLLLIIAMHLFLQLAQMQIVFYTALTFLISFFYYIIYALVKKDKNMIKQIIKTTGVFSVAAIIALLMSYDIYFQIYEYRPYSTRNADSSEMVANKTAKLNDSELYKYNTNWSFSPGEMITFIIPSYYGYGGFQYQGEITRGDEREVNTYFGQMELVNMPMYMGIVVLALGLFALYVQRKEPFIMFCGVTIILFLLISFGRNLPVVYDLMYRYFPMFNNFRVPSMILHIIQIIFPILAGLGVMKLIELNEANNLSIVKFAKYCFFGSAALLLLAINQENSLANWFWGRIEAAAIDGSEKSKMLMLFAGYTTKMFLSDIFVALILLMVLFLFIWIYSLKKINRIVFVGVVVLIVLFDLIRIAERGSIYIDRLEIEDLFLYQKQVTAIKKQQDKEPFRIVDMRQNGLGTIGLNNSYYTYFLLEDIAGSSAVKPKSYDDIIKAIGLNNLVFWKMANVKYVISDFPIQAPEYQQINKSDDVYTYKYLNALPRAYFVDSVAVKSSSEIFEALKLGLFDPAKVAFTEAINFNLDKADSSVYSKIINYSDERIELNANASGNNFMVFATTYMPVGWKAFIDGLETKILRANHTFMGIIVPKGTHKIEFVYAPASFFIGKYISLALNIIVLGSLIIVLIKKKKRKLNNLEKLVE